MLDIKNLYKAFDGKEVLHDINAVFEPGKVNMIIGQSGSGKTVLLKCIVGLHFPDKGEVLYDNRNFMKMNKKEVKMLRREQGMLFQGSALFDSMTVLENVMFPLNMFSTDKPKKRMERAMFCLERVNLKGAEDKYPSEVSGGMQKRVAIARAIALNPKYLFCDEPNSGLDPKTSLVIDALVQDITREYNMTTVVNTHDMNSVMGIGDHIVFINQGIKEWEGSKEGIFTSVNKNLNDFVFASDLFKEVKNTHLNNLEG
ncbi:MAG: ATP-binding cassette domain-containing protein [Candidatus Azobacteroides sp.]|nr:ATP-binding cassette domain-containing protein [Candidatus Azobacteroides sp.]